MAPAYICCAVSRVTAPAVFSSLNAKGRDSLHEVDVPDRVRVCTACGKCSTFTIASPFIDGRKSVPSRAHANMRATTEGGPNPKVR